MNIQDIKYILEDYKEKQDQAIILESYCITDAINNTAKSVHPDREASQYSDRLSINKNRINQILKDLYVNITI